MPAAGGDVDFRVVPHFGEGVEGRVTFNPGGEHLINY